MAKVKIVYTDKATKKAFEDFIKDPTVGALLQKTSLTSLGITHRDPDRVSATLKEDPAAVIQFVAKLREHASLLNMSALQCETNDATVFAAFDAIKSGVLTKTHTAAVRNEGSDSTVGTDVSHESAKLAEPPAKPPRPIKSTNADLENRPLPAAPQSTSRGFESRPLPAVPNQNAQNSASSAGVAQEPAETLKKPTAFRDRRASTRKPFQFDDDDGPKLGRVAPPLSAHPAESSSQTGESKAKSAELTNGGKPKPPPPPPPPPPPQVKQVVEKSAAEILAEKVKNKEELTAREMSAFLKAKFEGAAGTVGKRIDLKGDPTKRANAFPVVQTAPKRVVAPVSTAVSEQTEATEKEEKVLTRKEMAAFLNSKMNQGGQAVPLARSAVTAKPAAVSSSVVVEAEVNAVVEVSPVTFKWQSKSRDPDKVYAEITKFNRVFAGELSAFRQEETDNCFLVVKDSKDDLSNLGEGIQEAFVVVGEEVFYVNKDKQIQEKLQQSPADVFFDQKLENRKLSEEDLGEVRANSHYLRPRDLEFTIVKQANPSDFARAMTKLKGQTGADLSCITCRSQTADHPVVRHFEGERQRMMPAEATQSAAPPKKPPPPPPPRVTADVLKKQSEARQAMKEQRQGEDSTSTQGMTPGNH